LDGGAEATNLQFYPFLHEILRFLQATASGQEPPALAVFSGHDTVIAPLLSALGVYRDGLCRWPSYASRIAFELYQESTKLASGSSQFYVRALFNGKVLRGLRGCRADEELCHLDDFAKGVSSLLGGALDVEAACAG